MSKDKMNRKTKELFLSLEIVLINQEVATETLWMNFMSSTKDAFFHVYV